jgi:hypothetical protein
MEDQINKDIALCFVLNKSKAAGAGPLNNFHPDDKKGLSPLRLCLIMEETLLREI